MQRWLNFFICSLIQELDYQQIYGCQSPIKSNHNLLSRLPIGMSSLIADGKYDLSIEGYYKNMNNMLEYKEGSNFLNLDESWEDKVAVGDGWSYGAEFLFRKKEGNFNGWIGYTLSYNNRTI